MSIYRKFDAMRLPSNDLYASSRYVPTPPVERAVTPAPSPAQTEQHKRRRKAEPSNVPLPRTFAWVEGLPSSVQPTALVRQYARIANVVAATWGDPKAFNSYMNSLINDDRGGRKGFPADTLRELLALRNYHAVLNAGKLSI